MSNEKPTQTETVIPTMTLEKVNLVVANLISYVVSVLKTDKKNHPALRVNMAIEDTVNTNIDDETRYSMYQILRQTAKVWSMAHLLPQRIATASKTPNELNYIAQNVLAVNNEVANISVAFIEMQYRRPAHVNDVDKAKGVKPTPRQHNVESFTAQLLKDRMRASNNLYDENQVYDAIIADDASTDEVEG